MNRTAQVNEELPVHASYMRSEGCQQGGDRSVLQLFADCVAAGGNACAVEAHDETLSYAELDSRANSLADVLRSLGLDRNETVAVCLKRSAAMIASLLAVWKAGAGYLPLDPTYPPERLEFVLKDAGVRAVLIDVETAQDLLLDGISVLDPTTLSRTKRFSSPGVSHAAAAHDLAYVIYTSGSTGQPKGVRITHGNLLNLISWHCQAFDIGATDRATQVSSPGFDAAVWEIWPYLTSGASLHLPDEDIRGSPELLRDWMGARAITIGFVPTVMAEKMICLPWPEHTKLRAMLTGGDVLHRHPPEGLPFELVNNYGPTECTVVATSAVVPAGRGDSPPAIGRPIRNVSVHILDERLAPVPPGDIGEIYIGGAGVGAGYVNRPQQNAESFIQSPLIGRERLYRTGDLGTILPDGQIAFHGRADDQIKIRGYRIEPQEIVAVLNAHPHVRSSAVQAQENSSGEKMLVAYIVPSETPPSHRSLVELLREKLPEYMLPSRFMLLEAFPLTSHGKLDRRSLPAVTAENAMHDDVSEPRTIIESKLMAILEELLELEQVGREDNFFLLGGNSLLGTQVIAKVRDTFQVDLSLRSLFESPTVDALAGEIETLILQSPTSPQSDSCEIAADEPRTA